MKTITDLQAERKAAYDAMQAQIKLAEKENRELTEKENAEWDENAKKIEELDKQIARLEKQEELNKRFIEKKEPKSPERKLMDEFDLFKAFREVVKGNLSGAELEIHQEGAKRFAESGEKAMDNAFLIPYNLIRVKSKPKEDRAIAYVATGDGTPPIKTGAADRLEIVRDELIIDKVGVTMYEGLTGNFKLPSMGQLSAAFVSEETAVDSAGTALAANTLAPRRVGSGDIFTKELWAQTNPNIQNQVLAEFVNAIYRAVQVDLFGNVAAEGTILTGYAITDTVAALDHAAILALESNMKETNDLTAFVCSLAQRAKLKALALGTSIRFAWMDNDVNGYRAFATAALAATNGGSTDTAYDVIQGNFKGAAIGSWGGIELVVDPYTYSANGAYKVTANGLFDTGVANALHFAVIRNADA